MERTYRYFRMDVIRAALDALGLHPNIRVRVAFEPVGEDGTTVVVVDPVSEDLTEVDAIIFGERLLDEIDEILSDPHK